LQIPLTEYQPLESACLGELPVLRLEREIRGKPRTVLLFISEQLRQGQIRGLMQHLKKALRALARWKSQLAKTRSGPRSAEAANRQIHTLLAAQHLNKVLKVDYDPTREGIDRLHYQIDAAALTQLQTELYGKRILVTDRSEWSDEQILLAYRGQSEVEDGGAPAISLDRSENPRAHFLLSAGAAARTRRRVPSAPARLHRRTLSAP
jgi:hypothetical protein